jgi:hypothetical protein
MIDFDVVTGPNPSEESGRKKAEPKNSHKGRGKASEAMPTSPPPERCEAACRRALTAECAAAQCQSPLVLSALRSSVSKDTRPGSTAAASTSRPPAPSVPQNHRG